MTTPEEPIEGGDGGDRGDGGGGDSCGGDGGGLCGGSGTAPEEAEEEADGGGVLQAQAELVALHQQLHAQTKFKE